MGQKHLYRKIKWRNFGVLCKKKKKKCVLCKKKTIQPDIENCHYTFKHSEGFTQHLSSLRISLVYYDCNSWYFVFCYPANGHHYVYFLKSLFYCLGRETNCYKYSPSYNGKHRQSYFWATRIEGFTLWTCCFNAMTFCIPSCLCSHKNSAIIIEDSGKNYFQAKQKGDLLFLSISKAGL